MTKKKMTKTTGLDLVLNRSLRSKELTTLLNNLGHSVSYDDILRIDTTCAAGILEDNNEYSTVPTSIRENIFTQATADNGDYSQENNSQHVTNTVLYQYPELPGSYAHNTIPCCSRKNFMSIIRCTFN